MCVYKFEICFGFFAHFYGSTSIDTIMALMARSKLMLLCWKSTSTCADSSRNSFAFSIAVFVLFLTFYTIYEFLSTIPFCLQIIGVDIVMENVDFSF